MASTKNRQNGLKPAFRLGLTLLVAAGILISLSTVRARAQSASKLYWGAYVTGDAYGMGHVTAPWSTAAWDQFEVDAGKRVSILHFGVPWYTSNAWPHGYYPFVPSIMNTIRARGAIPMVDWGSWNSSAVGASQTAFSLRNIANGATVGYGGETFDQYVTQWAQAAKAWGHPFFLRFDWEMNGNWQFPWSAQLNGNTPADFIAAWRHVHDIFTRVGATNVTWVWCPNVHSSNTVPMALVYPGDAYVDWVALDAYNKAPKLWLSFAQLVAGGAWNGNLNSYHEITSLAPNKPLMIGEIASLEAGDGGAKKAAWIQDALGTQISTNFPAIKAVVWFNWNADANSSYVIESSAMAQAAFKQALAQPAYTTNSYANTTASPIPPAS